MPSASCSPCRSRTHSRRSSCWFLRAASSAGCRSGSPICSAPLAQAPVTACARGWSSGPHGRWSASCAGTRDEDPWAPNALAWPVLAVLDDCLDEPWATTLAQHLGHRDQRGRGRVSSGSPLRGGAPDRRAVRVVRDPATSAARRLGRRPRHRRSRRRSTPTSPGSHRSSGRWRPRSPRRCHMSATRRPSADSTPAPSSFLPACRCLATRGCRRQRSSCSRH